MKFILAEKQEMTQKFTEDGTVIPVTKLLVKPCVVTQIKQQERDGYFAIQLSTGQKRRLPKPLKGHFKDLGSFRYSREFRPGEGETMSDLESLKVGDQIALDSFVAGDKVQVTGVSKGKGFQGVVKRHGFHGHPSTHGHKDQLRMPGSIGSGGVQHVFKGVRMAGQMGNAQVTVKNLEVVSVEPETGSIYLKGAVPGSINGLISVIGQGEVKIQAPAVVKQEKPEETKATEDKPAEAPVVEEKKDASPEENKTEEKAVEEKSEEKKEVENKQENN